MFVNFLDAENKRLDAKKKNIDTALESKDRIEFLKENYRERYAIYVNLAMYLTITLVFVIVFNSLSNYYPESSIIFNILSLGIVAVAVYFAYYDIQKLYTRDNIYFDELALAAPDASGNINYTVDSSNILLPDIYLGAQYCDNTQNVFYDKSSGLCETVEKIDPKNIVASNEYSNSGNSLFKYKDYANQGYNNGNQNTKNTASPTSNSASAFTTLDLAYSNGEIILTMANNASKVATPYEKINFTTFYN